MTKAVLYIRVSTDKQAQHGISLEAQEAKGKAYANLYDLEIVLMLESRQRVSTAQRYKMR
jgi:DNA invertase Pin-like site-specific DNA recombinase